MNKFGFAGRIQLDDRHGPERGMARSIRSFLFANNPAPSPDRDLRG